MLTVSRNLVSVGGSSTRLLGSKQTVKAANVQTLGQCAGAAAERSEPVLMKVSDCKTEREHALSLVQKVYSRAGLTQEDLARLRVMRQHLAEDTEIIVGKRDSQVVFTVTLVGDGEYGLPLESLFESEVAGMRSRGLRLAEVSCLAHDSSFGDERGRFETFVQGISLLLQVARDRGIDRLLLAVHPRHAKVYERLLGCERCSDVREYAAVQGNPAVLCMHDFAKLDQKRYPFFNRMYGQRYAPWQIRGLGMSDAEKHYFEQFLPSGEYEFMPMAG